MKNIFKKTLLVIGTVLITSMTTMASVHYSLYVNGEKMNGKIIVDNGTTYVPLRLIGEKLNANISVKNGVINVVSKNDKSQNSGGDNVDSVLTDSDIDLVSDVKKLFNIDIVFKDGVIYRMENGELYSTQTREFWQDEINEKIKAIENFKKAQGKINEAE